MVGSTSSLAFVSALLLAERTVMNAFEITVVGARGSRIDGISLFLATYFFFELPCIGFPLAKPLY
jgi:hypothetical protein